MFKPKRTEETKRSLLGTLSESISSIFAYDPILEAFSNLTLEEYLENESHEKLENFIKQQLNISGIVHPSLLRQPNSPNRLIQFTFYVRDKSLRDFFFHNDHNFFNIITYFKKSDSVFNPVFGSDILFTDQSKFTYHGSAYPLSHFSQTIFGISDTPRVSERKLNGMYHEDFGKVAKLQGDITDLYTNSEGKQNSILRGIYNSGDSLLLSDMLVKHSAINPNEIINKNILKIGIIDRKEDTIESEVKVCSYRKQTTRKDIINRGIISIFVNIFPPDVVLLPSPYSFNFTSHKVTEVPEVPEANLSLDEYNQFLHNLTHDGCFKLFDKAIIKTRGGKYKRGIHKKTKRKSRNFYN